MGGLPRFSGVASIVAARVRFGRVLDTLDNDSANI